MPFPEIMAHSSILPLHGQEDPERAPSLPTRTAWTKTPSTAFGRSERITQLGGLESSVPKALLVSLGGASPPGTSHAWLWADSPRLPSPN